MPKIRIFLYICAPCEYYFKNRNMLNIGCHLSLSKVYAAMGATAVDIAANTFQFFTRNPRGGAAREMDVQDAAALAKLMDEKHFAPLLAHAPYTLNGCPIPAEPTSSS